ncbi:MAG: hypothetical protein DLM63_05965 [Solirubrobacterales bacterium]|nr:MAG: hypothetical protein DLM63_05965 [Solirubrobacterales bacterium]
MAVDTPQRISIGFHGGQVLAVRVTPTELGKLRKALEANDARWYELADAEGAALVDLGRIEYVRVDSDEHKIGF